MAIQVTFTVDADFTESDLKSLLAYRDYAIALWEIQQHVRLMYRGKRDISSMSASDVVEDIYDVINKQMNELPELE